MTVDEVPNTPPKFERPVEANWKIMLVKDEDGGFEGGLYETYRSPRAIDQENDEVILLFEGEKDFM